MSSIAKSIEKVRSLRHLNALITETFELAEKQRSEAESRGLKPFSVVVKDNFAVEDVPFTCASAMLAKYISPYTATCVQRLIENGGCIVGKANMDEFAMGSTNVDSYFGPAKNPNTSEDRLDADYYVAGGSSGGCAVAVASGFADVAIGSDTGGSTRNPASFCGVVGFKPSYGVISRSGLVPLANSFDSPSLFSRTVEECERYFGYVVGRDPKDCTSLDLPAQSRTQLDPRKLRIGVPAEFTEDLYSKDCGVVYENAINSLKSMGAQIKTVSLPHTKYSVACYHILNESDVMSNMARYDGVEYGNRCSPEENSFEEMLVKSRTSALNHVVRRRIFAGNFFNLEENKGKYFLQAAKVRRLIQQDFEKVFRESGVDAILTPSTSHSAPTISEVKAKNAEESRNDDFFTQSANMCGLPAVSVPFGLCSRGLPLGAQFICEYLADWKCLQIGSLLNPAAN